MRAGRRLVINQSSSTVARVAAHLARGPKHTEVGKLYSSQQITVFLLTSQLARIVWPIEINNKLQLAGEAGMVCAFYICKLSPITVSRTDRV